MREIPAERHYLKPRPWMLLPRGEGGVEKMRAKPGLPALVRQSSQGPAKGSGKKAGSEVG